MLFAIRLFPGSSYWLESAYEEDKEGSREKIYKELEALVAEMIGEDSRIVLANFYEQAAKKYETVAKEIREVSKKRFKRYKRRKSDV